MNAARSVRAPATGAARLRGPTRRWGRGVQISPGARAAARAGAAALPILLATLLWTFSLLAVDTRRIGDVGLVSALPAGAFAALALACCGFALALGRKALSTPLVLLHIVAIVFMLYGAVSLLDEEPAFNVVWRHAGVTDHIATTGDIDPRIDAYFNWPGFFLWAALVTEAAGLDSTLAWSGWSPVFFQLSYLPALVVISRAFTEDRRLAWSAVGIFYLTNWVGQDYFSPQAMGYLVYLTMIAVGLTYFARRGSPVLGSLRERGKRLAVALRLRGGAPLAEVAPPRAREGQLAALVAVSVVMVGAIVGSHQLTPFMIFGSITALMVVRRYAAVWLPAITLVLLLAWLSYMAAAYLEGHLKPMLGQALDLNESVSANLGSRLDGSAGHLLVVRLRLLMTGLVWLLAVAGAVRAMRAGRFAPAHAVLAAAPAVFVLLQPYGGEMLLRVYLFSLPFTACFAAQALAPRRGTFASWQGVLAVAASAALLLVGFLYTRYGNESATLFTGAEVRAIDRLYEVAPSGSLLVAVSPNLPWKHRHYAGYRYHLLSSRFEPETPGRPRDLASAVADYMTEERRGGRAYLVITRSQRIYDDLLGARSWGSASDLQRAASRSPYFRSVVESPDASIFELRTGPR